MPCSSSIRSTSLRLRLDCAIGFILRNPPAAPQRAAIRGLSPRRCEAYAPGLALVLLRTPQQERPAVAGVDDLIQVPAVGGGLAEAVGQGLAIGHLLHGDDF